MLDVPCPLETDILLENIVRLRRPKQCFLPLWPLAAPVPAHSAGTTLRTTSAVILLPPRTLRRAGDQTIFERIMYSDRQFHIRTSTHGYHNRYSNSHPGWG